MNGERGHGSAQFGIGSGGNSQASNSSNGAAGSTNNYPKQYNYNCCGASGAYPGNIGRVQVTAKILFGSVAAIQTVNAEKCRKK